MTDAPDNKQVLFVGAHTVSGQPNTVQTYLSINVGRA